MANVHVTDSYKAYNLNFESSDSFLRTLRFGEPLPVKHQSFLHDLATEGDVLTAELVIERGGAVDVLNEDGRTPLHEAVFFGHTEMAFLLIECGANINAALSGFGHTPLYLAVTGGYLAMAQLLLSHGADVHVKDGLTGQGLLHIAAAAGNARMAGILIENGIDVLAEDNRGQTARDYAVRARNEDMDRVLLKVMMHYAGELKTGAR